LRIKCDTELCIHPLLLFWSNENNPK